ncbi:MAG: hypothetical protein IIA01_02995 [Proteobacteria bacterium]|nr:hypothetical protein [Pseudomonadota bacterium]
MLVGILCRICRCLAGGPREREPSAKPAGDAVAEERTETAPEAQAEAEGQAPVEGAEGGVDDLTAIRGIGITTQDRLNRAGITTYAQLAEAKPEHVREALGKLSGGARVEAWISRARELAGSK